MKRLCSGGGGAMLIDTFRCVHNGLLRREPSTLQMDCPPVWLG